MHIVTNFIQLLSQSSELLGVTEKQLLEEECSALVSTHPKMALPMLVQLGLSDVVTCKYTVYKASKIILSYTETFKSAIFHTEDKFHIFSSMVGIIHSLFAVLHSEGIPNIFIYYQLSVKTGRDFL